LSLISVPTNIGAEVPAGSSHQDQETAFSGRCDCMANGPFAFFDQSFMTVYLKYQRTRGLMLIGLLCSITWVCAFILEKSWHHPVIAVLQVGLPPTPRHSSLPSAFTAGPCRFLKPHVMMDNRKISVFSCLPFSITRGISTCTVGSWQKKASVPTNYIPALLMNQPNSEIKSKGDRFQFFSLIAGITSPGSAFYSAPLASKELPFAKLSALGVPHYEYSSERICFQEIHRP
jgi:hypothetical protein